MNHFEVFKGIDGHWYWRLVGANGEIVAASEAYSSSSNARRAALRFPDIAKDAVIEESENE